METTTAIHPLITKRHSPRAFADTPVEAEKLDALFEAARWAASSYNEQPWRFIVASKGDAAYETLLEGLNPWNRSWAEAAPVLVYGIAKKHFSHNNAENRHAWYDLGAAVANFSIQAAELDLYLHQMAGIFPDKMEEALNVPDEYEVVVALALGYKGDVTSLPADLQEKETAPRQRKPLTELVFAGTWGG